MANTGPLESGHRQDTFMAIYHVFLFQFGSDTSVVSSCVGVPLIAVNPFQDVPELYDSKMINRYKNSSAVEIKV